MGCHTPQTWLTWDGTMGTMQITPPDTHLLRHTLKGLPRQLEPGRQRFVPAHYGPHICRQLEGKDNMADHQQDHWKEWRDGVHSVTRTCVVVLPRPPDRP